MTLKTKLAYGDTIRMLMKAENIADEMRKTLNGNPHFAINAAFQTMDSNSNGYLSKTEFKEFLEKHDFFATQKEIDLLFARFDRDRDERVTYGEFFMEMAPKLNY